MRYFFHVLNMGELHDAHTPASDLDRIGTILTSRQAARHYAAAIAAELAQDGDDYSGFVVFAFDENGIVVATVPVATKHSPIQ